MTFEPSGSAAVEDAHHVERCRQQVLAAMQQALERLAAERRAQR